MTTKEASSHHGKGLRHCVYVALLWMLHVLVLMRTWQGEVKGVNTWKTNTRQMPNEYYRKHCNSKRSQLSQPAHLHPERI